VPKIAEIRSPTGTSNRPLTTGVDAVADFTGTAADDTFTARATNATTGVAATTVNDGDTLDGGAGSDTLNITATADNNRSLTGLAVSNIETINIAGANNLGTLTTAAAAATAGAAQVQVLDITASRRLGELQTVDFAGVNVLTAGNILVGSTIVALAAGDGPQAIATKVKAALDALTTEVSSVTQSGSLLTVRYLAAVAATGADIADVAADRLDVTLPANTPITKTGTLPTTTAGVVTVTEFDDSNVVTVTINGVQYTQAVTDTADLSLPAVAAPAAPTVVTTQGVAAVTETNVVTFGQLTAGQSVTVNGVTLTAGATTASAAAVALFFSGGATPDTASVTGTQGAGFVPTLITTGSAVTYTSTTAHTNVTNVATSVGAVGGATAPTAPTVVETAGKAVGTESSTVTFGALAAGQSVTVADRTVTAKVGGAGLTNLEVAAAFATTALADSANLVTTGTLTGFTGVVTTNTVAMTSTTLAPAAPAVVTTQGVTGTTTETNAITFGSLVAGQSVTVAGRTVTATGAMTGANVAAAFATDATTATNGTITGALLGFGGVQRTATAVVDFASSTATTNVTDINVSVSNANANVADIVVSTAGTNATALATGLAATTAAVTTVLNNVIGGVGGSVTVAAGDEAGEIKLTSKTIGGALPTVSVSQGTALRSGIDTVDGATAANAARSQTAAAKQVVTFTVADGDIEFATGTSLDLYVDGLKVVTNATAGATVAAVATALAAAINTALGATSAAPIATAVGGTVTVTAAVAGTALPRLGVDLNGTLGTGEAITFAELVPNTQAVAQVVSAGSASVNAAQFVGSELVNLSGTSGSASVTGVTAGQTIGFTGVAMANTVAFGALTSGSVAVNASAGTLTTTGKALTTLALSGTGTSGLTITDGDTVTATGLAPITTLNLSTSGSTVLNTASMGSLATLTQTGAGGVTLTPGTKLASITTGAGADTLRVSTATAIDNPGTTTNEAVNAVVNSAAGNDRLIIATTGAATTTVDAGAGDDTLFVSTLSTGQNSLSGGDGNDAFRISSGSGLIAGLQNTTISGGAGNDTLRVSNTTFAASDYTILTANVSSVETLELAGVVTALDASKVSATALRFLASGSAVTEVGSGQAVTLARTAVATATTGFTETGVTAAVNPSAITVSSKGFILDNDATVAGRQSVFGDNLGVTLTNTAAATTVTANGNALTLGVVALGETTTVGGNNTVATVAGELTSINVALESKRGTAGTTVADVENVAGFIASVVANNLDDVTSITVTGSGTANITAGTIAAVDAKLTTINVSGMTAFADQNLLGDLQGGVFTNRSTTTITLNNNVAETVLLGGAKDTVATGSTIVARDVVTGFQVTAAADGLTVDTTRSDVLKIGTAFDSSATIGTANYAAKMTVTGSTLEAALLQAAGLKGGALGTTDIDKVVFNFGGNTYVYVDTGANGLTDNDQLVQLSGTLNLDLLLQSGVIIA
jgi:hypothetical protein